ncbi:hypothetical protein ACFFF5_03165 [Lederbergia wuyishanensis]|uniref:ATP synthase F0 subunit 8 n=1 Tax=Lederbergia wuyishanensis TaxID=1347903 RepID=A0ABU0D067_9BACI|nr:hypothetical protein [Lederbergia wuyishanensis]MDQ0341793.1 hypothetical protein [Lederbergia wuyishanensis]
MVILYFSIIGGLFYKMFLYPSIEDKHRNKSANTSITKKAADLNA